METEANFRLKLRSNCHLLYRNTGHTDIGFDIFILFLASEGLGLVSLHSTLWACYMLQKELTHWKIAWIATSNLG